MARLSVNDIVTEAPLAELSNLIRTISLEGEIWLELDEDGPMMCALLANDEGWLMFLRNPGDAGFSTRNPKRSTEEKARFRLANGQVDEYPLRWCYSAEVVRDAFIELATTKQRPTNVVWRSDG